MLWIIMGSAGYYIILPMLDENLNTKAKGVDVSTENL